MKLGMEVGPGHTVLHRNPAPPPKGHRHPFSAYVCCGQMAGWIKMPHGMEVGLSPGHIVLDEHPAPHPQRGTARQFSAHVYCGQMAEWIKMPLGMEVDLGPGHIVRWKHCSCHLKRGTAGPLFSVDVYCGKWSSISTTAEYFIQFLVPSS